HLLDQVSPPLRRKRPGQMLFCGSQHTLQADDEEILQKVCVDVPGTASHVFLFKTGNPFANGCLDFPLRFHTCLASCGIIARSLTSDGAYGRIVALSSHCSLPLGVCLICCLLRNSLHVSGTLVS